MWNLPNILTLLRIGLIPVFIVDLLHLLGMAQPDRSGRYFGLAAATDWVDGYMARKYNQVTPFGAFSTRCRQAYCGSGDGDAA